MNNKIKDSFGNINKNIIITFEKEIGHSLPLTYASFLLKNNGGKPTKDCFRTKNQEYETDVQFFFGLNSDKIIYDLKENYNMLKSRIPSNTLAVAIDSIGGFILLNLESGSIFYFDHEVEEQYIVADTFETFVKDMYLVELEKSI